MDEGFEVFGEDPLISRALLATIAAGIVLLILALFWMFSRRESDPNLLKGEVVSRHSVPASCHETELISPSSDLRIDVVDGSLTLDEIDCQPEHFWFEVETAAFGSEEVVRITVDENDFYRLKPGDSVLFREVDEGGGISFLELASGR